MLSLSRIHSIFDHNVLHPNAQFEKGNEELHPQALSIRDITSQEAEEPSFFSQRPDNDPQVVKPTAL